VKKTGTTGLFSGNRGGFKQNTTVKGYRVFSAVGYETGVEIRSGLQARERKWAHQLTGGPLSWLGPLVSGTVRARAQTRVRADGRGLPGSDPKRRGGGRAWDQGVR
jgi:hypothetical protein